MNSLSNKKGVIVIEGHVQGLANTRILGKAGIPVIVVDKSNCVAKYSRYCKNFFFCPDYLTDDFAYFLVRLNKAYCLQDWLLLPSNDHAVLTIAKHKDRLKSYYKVITEDINTIEKIYNKRELLRIANGIDVPIPKTVSPVFHNPTSVDLRFPIIIKGNNGLSFYKKFHHKAVILKTPFELKNIWMNELSTAVPGEYFIQEVIPPENKTVSVTVFAIDGVVHSYWMGVKLREHPLTFGTATCSQSIFEEDLLGLSRKLICELGFTGVCEIEWLRDSRDNEPKLIEINARTWLWVGLAEKCGISYPKLIYDYIYSGIVSEFEGYTIGTIWLNLYTDLIYSTIRVFKGIDTVKGISGTYKTFFEACWDVKDPIPFVMYGILMASFVRKR